MTNFRSFFFFNSIKLLSNRKNYANCLSKKKNLVSRTNSFKVIYGLKNEKGRLWSLTREAALLIPKLFLSKAAHESSLKGLSLKFKIIENFK